MVNRYLWDDENGIYRDYDWRREQLALPQLPPLPLYVGMANHEQVSRSSRQTPCSRLLTRRVLGKHMKPVNSGDKTPTAGHRYSGWQFRDLKCMAMTFWDEIARSWLKTVNQFYLEQHKRSKIPYCRWYSPRSAAVASIRCRMGLGWINGVVRRLIGLYGEP